MGLDGLGDLFRELGELEYLEERGDFLTELGYPVIDVGDLHIAEDLEQFVTSGPDAAAPPHFLEAI